MRHLVSWAADSAQFGQPTSDVLRNVLATAPSPELIPQQAGAAVQSAEGTVGPYALQDFNLYYVSRFGYRPSRVAYLALHAWGDSGRGAWLPGIAASDRVAYDLPTIIGWLQVFIERFFATSQFKRSASPDGPKIGSGGSLSPRGDWRAPSDSHANAWLSELRSALVDLSTR